MTCRVNSQSCSTLYLLLLLKLSPHRERCRLVKHRLLTMTVETWVGITASYTVQLHNTACDLVSYKAYADQRSYRAFSWLRAGQLLRDDRCPDIDILVVDVPETVLSYMLLGAVVQKLCFRCTRWRPPWIYGSKYIITSNWCQNRNPRGRLTRKSLFIHDLWRFGSKIICWI